MKIILHATGNIFESQKLLTQTYLEHLLNYYKSKASDCKLIIDEQQEVAQQLSLQSDCVELKEYADQDLLLFINSDIFFYVFSKEEVFDEYFKQSEQITFLKTEDKYQALLIQAGLLKQLVGADFDFRAKDLLQRLALALGEQKVERIEVENSLDFESLNNYRDLSRIFQDMLYEYKNHLLEQGVMMINPDSIVIEPSVKISSGTTILAGSYLTGKTKIAENCVIGPSARLENCQIAANVNIKDSTLIDSKVDSGTNVGPYAYLRPKSDIGKNCKIGDFVEVKNTKIDDGSKVSHLSYIGDGKVGKNVNVGCGTVFVNYDGKNKHLTEVEDNVFVGCNSNLVAPVKISAGAYIAAGSTITDAVPESTLAIARARQVIKNNWKSPK